MFVKGIFSSFHCVENLLLSTPRSIVQGKIVPSVAVVLCFCLFVLLLLLYFVSGGEFRVFWLFLL